MDNAAACRLSGTDHQHHISPKRHHYAFDEPFIVNVLNSQVSIQLALGISSLYDSPIEDLRYNRYAVRSAIIRGLYGSNLQSVYSDVTKPMVMSEVKSAISKALQSDNVDGHFERLYLTNFLVRGLYSER